MLGTPTSERAVPVAILSTRQSQAHHYSERLIRDMDHEQKATFVTQGTPTSERAMPVAIFSTEPTIARAFLRKWCGDVCEGPPFDAPAAINVPSMFLQMLP